MFNGVFKRLDTHQLAALVSCLVFVERTHDEIRIAAALAEPLAQLQVRRGRGRGCRSGCGQCLLSGRSPGGA